MDARGRLHFPAKAGGRLRLKNYMDEMEGVPVQDVWTDIGPLGGTSPERLGYPTQKPVSLLDRIVEASSDVGDVVLDPFCGCGTAVASAQRLGRRWIGIDVTHLAISLIKRRLFDTYGKDIVTTYRTIGEPTDVQGAKELAESDPFQFQAWALGFVGARIATSAKKGGDKGIDGRLFFHDEGPSDKTKQIIFSVKAGHLVPNYVRDLRGVLDRENAEIGVLLSFETPTVGMRAEAALAGFYASPWGTKHPRIQLLTVAQLLTGGGVNYPNLRGGNVTVKRAPRVEREAAEQSALNMVADEPDPR